MTLAREIKKADRPDMYVFVFVWGSLVEIRCDRRPWTTMTRDSDVPRRQVFFFGFIYCNLLVLL
jgi:hypothetical protein